MKYSVIIFLFYKFLICHLIAQEIPNEFYQFKFQKERLNAGDGWENNSIFGPTRFANNNSMNDSLIIKSRLGMNLLSNAMSLYGYGHFTFKSNFHGYLYSRIVNNPELFDRYSGLPRDISRFGLNSGETDNSGISFENDWMIIQFGRGRQSWGSGNDIQLMLSENSCSYDHGMLDLDFGKLRVRYFHGYLETDSSSYSRYITGRGIEWNNKKNLIFGLSEIAIYSGQDRHMDFAYVNPISTHLEIELNDRQNDLGSDNGNGVWQCSFDYYNQRRLRISGNYLIDEFVIDKIQKDQGKGHGNGYSLKFVFSPIMNKTIYSSLYVSIISIGTNTFKHEDGRNNFVQRNKPLGWVNGSDTRELKIGINTISKLNKFFLDIEFGSLEIGEENILNQPYDGYDFYTSGKFPSGNIEKKIFLNTQMQLWIRNYFSILARLKMVKSSDERLVNEFKIGFDSYFPISIKI